MISNPTVNKRVSTRIKAAACIGFLALSIVLWIKSGGSWLVWLLLLIPCFLCEEWLADKFSLQGSGLSIAESGFFRSSE